MMRTVLLSLSPILILSVYNYGLRVLVLLIVVTIAGTAVEYLWERHYNNKPSEAIFVTCLLYTMTLPPSIPYWIALLGIVFGVIFGKMVFGGFGRNVFNPALVGRAFIYINFPNPMTIAWNEAASGFPGGFSTYLTAGIDAVSEATPMISYNYTGEIMDLNYLILGNIPGAIGESFKILIILAAIYLVYTKTASLEIMLGCLIGFFAAGSLMYYFYDGISPIYGIMMGGFLFGTVFMATDPISAAKTKKGKWVFGIIIGLVTVLIRALSLFNGGMMFAILMGNTFAPIIDYFIKEAEKRKKDKAVTA
ncbi:MAG: RnfABCDGE type electron transport complex subunit D [Sedimentibacter sp.]|nr:RnfABCDGE type electron transport complex subunit D [Sedimentibacter sp.]